MNPHKFLSIKTNFNEQYTIDIESEVNAVDMYITSKVRLRYDFTVLNIVENESFEIRLIQLENMLVEANNPMVKEVAQISQVFGKMYNELHLQLDMKGKILEVINYDVILSKWKQIKLEMEKALDGNDDIKRAITLNDEIYTNVGKVKMAVEANEFFKVYFGQIFGVNLPVTNKTIEGTNFFNTANLQWLMDINTTAFLPSEYQYVDVTMVAKPAFPLSEGFYNAAYNQFAEKINIKSLFTKLEQYEIRKVEINTGRVAEALITKTEIADEEKLFTKLKYTLRSDSFNNKNRKVADENLLHS